MYVLCSLLLLLNNENVVLGISKKISDDIINYFHDENIRSFNDKWEVHRASVENALELAIKDTFGKAGLNVYIKSVDDTHKVSDGFLIYDSVVYVLFKDMNLSRYPYLRNPRVSFPLPSNVLRVEASLSKMFIDSNYLLFRNYTEVVYPSNEEEESKASPFSRQQVQTKGQATIIAEHCVLHGDTVATLQGFSVNLGYDNFELDNCKFSLEISNPGLGSPPLIVPYFSKEQELQLEQLLIKTLRGELMPKLQAAVHSCVNTTIALGNLLPEVRQLQRNFFKEVNDYGTKVIVNLNKVTAEKNLASHIWNKYEIFWDEMTDGNIESNLISLTNMAISGLDSAYAGHSGGPVQTDTFKIYEDLRFSGLQIRGSGSIRMHGTEHDFSFSSEVQDIICKVTNQLNTDGNVQELEDKERFKMDGWRNLEINGPTFPTLDTYSFITGVLFNQLPELIIQHLSTQYKEAIEYTESPYEFKETQPDQYENLDSQEYEKETEIKQHSQEYERETEIINSDPGIEAGDENDVQPEVSINSEHNEVDNVPASPNEEAELENMKMKSDDGEDENKPLITENENGEVVERMFGSLGRSG